VDFRLGNDGIPYFLEVNPLPGLNPVSGDLPIMSGKMGITYNGLIEKIVTAAFRRYGSGA
jgi:D-alanine-D-alanine ligase